MIFEPAKKDVIWVLLSIEPSIIGTIEVLWCPESITMPEVFPEEYKARRESGHI